VRKLLTLIAVFVFLGYSCLGEPEKSPKTTKPHLKISVLKSGKIMIDGNEATLTQAEQRLTRLKSEGGTVWYYREAGQQEPPPEAMQVIKLIADNRLPITLSGKPDFSDYIGEDGKSYPRE